MFVFHLFYLAGFIASGSSVANPQRGGLSPPTPARQTGGSISHADYPAEAIRDRAHGTTEVSLSVGENGRVTDCSVVASAGHPALDAASCRLIATRFRYSPATRSGRPVASMVTRRIAWVLPAPPVGTLTAMLAITVGTDGRVLECSLATPSGDPGLDAHACRILRQYGQFEPARDQTGQAVTSTRTIPMYSRLPTETAPTPPRLTGGMISNADYPDSAFSARAEGATTIRLDIGADGRVSGCAVTASPGNSALDSTTCSLARRRLRFQPATSGGLPVTGQYLKTVTWTLPSRPLPSPVRPASGADPAN